MDSPYEGNSSPGKSDVLENQLGFRLPLPSLREWVKQQNKVNPEICQPTDSIFPPSKWSQEPTEQNQRLLYLVIWEHGKAAGREARDMAGKHAMLPLGRQVEAHLHDRGQ